MDFQPWLNDAEQMMAVMFSRALPTRTPSRRLDTIRSSAVSSKGGESVSSLQRAAIEEIRRHARRLAALSAALGRYAGLDEMDIERLRVGSLLHDVGKAAIPVEVLFKCGRLTAEEFAAVKFHPIIGDLLCAQVPALAPVRGIVRYHHERLDGSGYPDGLEGDEIPFLAQIVGTVDVYDALVHPRPYKPAFDTEHAFSILRREAKLGWRRGDLVEALFDVAEHEDAMWLSTAASV